MNKLRFESSDLLGSNIEKIAELFPAAVTEGKVNFDLLRSILGDEITGDEAYEFTWVGKRDAIREAGRPIRKTLRPSVNESKEWDTTENLYIEGDNLDVLKLLQESYLGKVKMIYIDPPYNTGSDFIYRDDFSQSSKKYDEETGAFDDEGNRQFVENSKANPRFHSNWCSMIYSPLVLARNLLCDNGVLFVSIDDNEFASLQKILDEVFGTPNFVGHIAWESKTKSQNTIDAYNKLQPRVEHILVYTKASMRRFNVVQKGMKDYPECDQRGEFRWARVEQMSANGMRGRESMVFSILGVVPFPDKQWKLGYDKIQSLISIGDCVINDGVPYIKMRPTDERTEVTDPFWAFFSKDMGTAESAKKELTQILGKHGFETVKPIDLIKRLVFHSTEKDSIILDFFSGSATTAHAVMQLNAEDGGHRKFIMVQLPEECPPDSEAAKAGYKNICEIGKERIRRAGEKIKDEAGLLAQNLDIGFRVLKLDDTNMKDVYYAAGDYSQDLLDLMTSNIKEDRTDLDLLYACLLDWGLPLSLPHTHEEIDGVTVHTYNNGDLIACFADQVSDTVVREIAKRQPLRVVFRDSSFSSSPEKINVEEIFKLLAPKTSVKVL